MADEQAQSSSGGKRRRRRRRSNRKRNRSGQPKNESTKSQPSQSSGSGEPSRSGRRRRRRRRSRSKGSSSQRQEQVAARDMLDATLPENIFVYTHVLRSSELDTYGFRSDPFMNQSRSLADFRVDLSPIFPSGAPDAGDEQARIFDAALHGAITMSLTESDYDENDDEDNDEYSNENGDENGDENTGGDSVAGGEPSHRDAGTPEGDDG